MAQAAAPPTVSLNETTLQGAERGVFTHKHAVALNNYLPESEGALTGHARVHTCKHTYTCVCV